ncbi:hypothetical protein [Actinacidiphila acididurans]|uniref:Uncharacterized protein n=1 Tax=Actinacidiphila acididurans TaxID=2784346 RepID=A0ABS2TQE8_9ACTN|nr:hypothetical protein [Actinacidiphila acididurans]MBM9505302.1 hypothetical protein [Actinacidiphila acididurans]
MSGSVNDLQNYLTGTAQMASELSTEDPRHEDLHDAMNEVIDNLVANGVIGNSDNQR